jgi:TonB family protein
MRRILASALILIPALAASAQAPSAANPMTAMLHLPHMLLAAPNGAMGAAPAKAVLDAGSIMVPVIQGVVKQNAQNGGFDTIGLTKTAPRLLRSVPLQLSLADMRSEAAHAVVVVRLTVDASGKPGNVAIVRSAGEAVDRRAIESVKQYEFAPARDGNIAVASTVTVSIDLKKS